MTTASVDIEVRVRRRWLIPVVTAVTRLNGRAGRFVGRALIVEYRIRPGGDRWRRC